MYLETWSLILIAWKQRYFPKFQKYFKSCALHFKIQLLSKMCQTIGYKSCNYLIHMFAQASSIDKNQNSCRKIQENTYSRTSHWSWQWDRWQWWYIHKLFRICDAPQGDRASVTWSQLSWECWQIMEWRDSRVLELVVKLVLSKIIITISSRN